MTVVQIPRTLFDAIFTAAGQAKPREAGGVLMGNHVGSAGSRRVTELVDGGPDASATRTSFNPDQQFQQSEVDKLFAKHDGNIEYLGDWHSHPGGVPYPSATDRGALKRIRAALDARCAEPIMLICGGRLRRTMHAFGLTPDGLDVREVSIVLID